MKAVIAVIVAVGGAVVLLSYMFSSRAKIDPEGQAAEARAKIAVGDSWTDVIDAIEAPSRWRDEATGDADADPYVEERWDEGTVELIRSSIEKDEYRLGFAFHYRFSKYSGFTINFTRNGEIVNIRDHASKSELLDE